MMISIALQVAETSPLAAEGIAVVRYLDVIMAHPRMQRFDFSVKRFKDGPSAQIPLEVLKEKEKELESRLQALNQRLEQEVGGLEKSLVGSKKDLVKAEKDFWKSRQKIDSEMEIIKNEIAANIAAMEFGGRTIETLLLPEINKIVADVTLAVANAARARKCTMVFNETRPQLYQPEIDNWIEEAYSLHFRSRETTDASHIKRWLSSSDRIVSRLNAHVNLLTPVITGAVDITADAVGMLIQPARKGGSARK